MKIPERVNLIFQFLLNIFLDTCMYCLFGIIAVVSAALANSEFLNYRRDQIPEILQKYIAAQGIFNPINMLLPAFAITFFLVFVKHTSNITADRSNEILTKIKKLNSERNNSRNG